MRRNHNKDGIFMDVGLLRDHISKLREEKKLASRLYENVVAMRNSAGPEFYSQYNSILRDIDQLIEYFGSMSMVISNTEAEAIRLSREIGALIEDGTERTHHVSSRAFML